MANILDILAGLFTGRRSRPGPTPTPPPPPGPLSTTPQRLLDAHNIQRERQGLSLLISNPLLQQDAQAHANAQAQRGKMGHDDVGDGTMAERIAAVGYHYRRVGENVAYGQRDVPAVVSAWMNSPGHRANILGNFTEAGLAVAYSPDGTPYWTAVFGLPARPGQFALAGSFAEEATPKVMTFGRGSQASSMTLERVSY